MIGEGEISEALGLVGRYLNSQSVSSAAYAVALFLASYFVLNLMITVVFAVAKKLSSRTKTNIDNLLLFSVQKPLRLAALVFSAYVALEATVPTITVMGKNLDAMLFIALVLLAGLFFARVFDALIIWYGKDVAPAMGKERRTKELFPMVRKIIDISIYLVALIVVLDFFGVQIAPLIAGLGIAGLAVALALQETLANFFAGMYILADKPVRLGDYVKLEDGTEGYVEEVGWRSTRIRLLTENSLIIPNSALAQQKIVNYNVPGTGLICSVAVGVAYDSNPDKVEKVLKETAKKVIKGTPTAVKEFEPVVRFVNLGDFALEYKVLFQVERFTDQWPVSHRMRKEILKAFRKEKIIIPFPTQVLHVKRNGA